MPEIEPLYIKEFRKEMHSSINDLAVMIKDNMVTKYEFEEFKTTVATKDDLIQLRKEMATKEDIKDMATKQDLEYMVTREDIRDMATKEDIKPILQLIGSYEIRAKNVDDILTKDHKLRIIDLEKEVFA